jgi:alkylation response protein AidB-like acyl-CoA dehydrogenase
MATVEELREMWRQRAKTVAREKVAPRAAEIDRNGEFPRDILQAFVEQGFLNLLIPGEYGGEGGDITSFCGVMEEIAYHCVSSSLLVVVQALGALPLVLGGSPELKERFLTRMAREHALVAFCLTEPEAGSDSASIRTRAVADGEHYVINGRKCFISNGGVSDLYTVFAITAPGRRADGISAFLVERDAPGLSIGKKEEKMGIRGSNTTEVVFEDVRVPRDQRIGVEGEGWRLAMRTLNRSRPGIGAQAVGLGQAALDYAIDFGKRREGFREAQGMLFLLADMAASIEAARALVYRTAALIDSEPRGTGFEKYSAMAKYFGADTAMRVTTDAVQVMGWHGVLREHPVERMMRDAKIIQIYEGTNQVQRMVVAGAILREPK